MMNYRKLEYYTKKIENYFRNSKRVEQSFKYSHKIQVFEYKDVVNMFTLVRNFNLNKESIRKLKNNAAAEQEYESAAFYRSIERNVFEFIEILEEKSSLIVEKL